MSKFKLGNIVIVKNPVESGGLILGKIINIKKYDNSGYVSYIVEHAVHWKVGRSKDTLVFHCDKSQLSLNYVLLKDKNKYILNSLLGE